MSWERKVTGSSNVESWRGWIHRPSSLSIIIIITNAILNITITRAAACFTAALVHAPTNPEGQGREAALALANRWPLRHLSNPNPYLTSPGKNLRNFVCLYVGLFVCWNLATENLLFKMCKWPSMLVILWKAGVNGNNINDDDGQWLFKMMMTVIMMVLCTTFIHDHAKQNWIYREDHVVDLEHLGHFNFLCFQAQAGKAASPVHCSLSTRTSI